MNRKTIIMCVTAIAVFLAVVSVALFFLYSDTGETRDSVAESREYMLFSAVPSDAVSVLRFSDFSSMLDCMVSEKSAIHYFVTDKAEPGKLVPFLKKISESPSLYGSLMHAPAVMSVHNIGDLTPLLILDAGKSQDGMTAGVDSLNSIALRCGLTAQYADASSIASADNPLRKGRCS